MWNRLHKILSNIKKSKEVKRQRRLWQRYVDGERFITTTLNYGMIFPEDVNREEIFSLKNGKKGVFLVLGLDYVDDWVSENIQLMFLGFLNEKMIADCTFEEYLKIYTNLQEVM